MSLYHELMDFRILQNVRPGASAMTSDGKKLGTIDHVEDHYIKVRVAFGRDYWLKADYVTEQTPDRITFSFARKDLGVYKADKPALAADPLADQQDAVLSEQEQIEQRARMERELAEQRRG